MGKSRHTKWYERNDDDAYFEHRNHTNNYKSRRAKRLRTIHDKHEAVEDAPDPSQWRDDE